MKLQVESAWCFVDRYDQLLTIRHPRYRPAAAAAITSRYIVHVPRDTSLLSKALHASQCWKGKLQLSYATSELLRICGVELRYDVWSRNDLSIENYEFVYFDNQT